MRLICFLMSSKEEKKMELTMQERSMETPKPRYIRRLKNSIFCLAVCSGFDERQFFW